MSEAIRAYVKAEITVEIDVGVWGGETNWIALHPRVVEEAKLRIQASCSRLAMKIVGEPKIKMITWRNDDKN